MIDGLITENEADTLRAYAKEVDTENSIVEIGSYKGKSTVSMLSESTSIVFAVDLWDKHTRPKYKTAKQAFVENTAPYRDRVRIMHMSSNEAAKKYKKVRIPIGMLFIDGCHKYNFVRDDFNNWTPFVKSGGYILFHDYINKKYGKGVIRFVDEVMKGSKFEFIELVESLYIVRKL